MFAGQIDRKLVRLLQKVSGPFRDIWVRRLDEMHTPVIIYQMGKVGSYSLKESLRKKGVWPVPHVHRMNPEYINEIRKERERKEKKPVFLSSDAKGLKLYRQTIKRGHRTKLISLVRNPVSRNVSAFFFNYVTEKQNWKNLSLEDLRTSFLSEYPHEVPLMWFDREPKVTLNVDVYNTSFPHNRGYMQLENDSFEILILRTELSDNRKAEAVEKFLGISGLDIRRYNTGQGKSYAEIYNHFKKEVSLPGSYLDRMLQSRYAQHFYSTEEIERAYSNWS